MAWLAPVLTHDPVPLPRVAAPVSLASGAAFRLRPLAPQSVDAAAARAPEQDHDPLGSPSTDPGVARELVSVHLHRDLDPELAREAGRVLCNELARGKVPRPDIGDILMDGFRSLWRRSGGYPTHFAAGVVEALGGSRIPADALRWVLASLLHPHEAGDEMYGLAVKICWALADNKPGLLSEALERELMNAIPGLSGRHRNVASYSAGLLCGLGGPGIRPETASAVLSAMVAAGVSERQARPAGYACYVSLSGGIGGPLMLRFQRHLAVTILDLANVSCEAAKWFTFGVLEALPRTGDIHPGASSFSTFLQALAACEPMPLHSQYLGMAAATSLTKGGTVPVTAEHLRLVAEALVPCTESESVSRDFMLRGFLRVVKADADALGTLLGSAWDAAPSYGKGVRLCTWAAHSGAGSAERHRAFEAVVATADALASNCSYGLGFQLSLMRTDGRSKSLEPIDLGPLIEMVLDPQRDSQRMDALLRGLLVQGQHSPALAQPCKDAIEQARRTLHKRQADALPPAQPAPEAAESKKECLPVSRPAPKDVFRDDDGGDDAAKRFVASGMDRKRPGEIRQFLGGAARATFEFALGEGQYAVASAMLFAICENSRPEKWDPWAAVMGAPRVTSIQDFQARVLRQAAWDKGGPLPAAERWMDRVVLLTHGGVDDAEPGLPQRPAAFHIEKPESKAPARLRISDADLDELIPAALRSKPSASAMLQWARKTFGSPNQKGSPHAKALGMRGVERRGEYFIPAPEVYPHIHIAGGAVCWTRSNGKRDGGHTSLLKGSTPEAHDGILQRMYDDATDPALLLALHYVSFESAREWRDGDV